MKKRIADIIMETLVEQGITDCFAVVGGGAMHLDNALGLNENINKIFNHHEQACAMAAESYARIEGKMPFVCVTSGPGATNTLTGVMGAWVDSLPMLILSGQTRYDISVPNTGLPLRFRGAQEFDIVNTVKTMTKYAKMIIDPLEVKRELRKAIRLSLEGRRAPVWLDIPLNVQMAEVEETEMYPDEIETNELYFVSEQDSLDIITKLNKAKYPVILAGNGITNSGKLKEFRELCEKLGVPVVAASQASDVFYRENDLFFGITGLIGWRSGNFVLQNADFILAIGTSLGFKTTGYAQDEFNQHAKIYMVDADEYEWKKPGLRIEKFIHSDVKSFLESISQNVQQIKVSEKWMKYCEKVKQRFDLFEATKNIEMEDRVCSYYFWKRYEKFEPENGISVLGNNTAISSKVQIGVLKEDQRTMTNVNCGSMGYDIPAAIGAAVAAKKEIICITGDGSIMMNLQELQTIKHYRLPVKVVVFSNDGYSAIRQTCKNFFDNKYIGCDSQSGVGFPNFEDVAKTFGFKYKSCKRNKDVDECLEWLFNNEGHLFLEVSQKLDDPIMPKIVSRTNDAGEFETPKLQDMYPFLSVEEMDSLMIK